MLGAIASSIGRPAFFWLVSEPSGEARGTAIRLHVSMASFGWIIVSTIGGLLIAAVGFGLLAAFSATLSLRSAACCLAVVAVQRCSVTADLVAEDRAGGELSDCPTGRARSRGVRCPAPPTAPAARRAGPPPVSQKKAVIQAATSDPSRARISDRKN